MYNLLSIYNNYILLNKYSLLTNYVKREQPRIFNPTKNGLFLSIYFFP